MNNNIKKEITIKESSRWMDNPDNAYNCGDCPENVNASEWGGNLPCGQQNCWVCCTCRACNCPD